jgi:hypothetical protein
LGAGRIRYGRSGLSHKNRLHYEKQGGENHTQQTIHSLTVVLFYVVILCPISVSAAILACSFGYETGLYVVNFPVAGVLFSFAIIVELDKIIQ